MIYRHIIFLQFVYNSIRDCIETDVAAESERNILTGPNTSTFEMFTFAERAFILGNSLGDVVIFKYSRYGLLGNMRILFIDIFIIKNHETFIK